MQVLRNIFYRVAHAQQVQHITGEPVGVANLTMSERYVRLPHPAALLAAETLYLQRQIAWLAAEGEVVQNAPDNAIFDDMETSAVYIQDRSAISGVEKDIPLCMTQRFW